MSSLNLAAALSVSDLPTLINQTEETLLKVFNSLGEPFSASLERLPHGKRLRPSLVFASAKAQHIAIDDKIITAAVAIELVHLASIIHDDIIDESETRRGVPTIHAAEGTNQALLVGDILFAAAYKQASSVNMAFAALIAETIITLCKGEAQEINQRHDLNRNEEMVREVIKNKTAVLIAAACQAPSVCASQDGSAVYVAGEVFGTVFQILDDLLDFVGNPKVLGKPVGGDIAEGNYTLPVVLALKSPQAGAITYQLNAKNPDFQKLVTLLFDSGAFRLMGKQTKALISQLNGSFLEKLAYSYTRWITEQAVDTAYKSEIKKVLIDK